MRRLLVLVFVVVPLLEILVILQVGAAIGGAWTALLLLAFSVLGAWLLGIEGRRAWSQFRTALAEGRWPGDEVTQGALVIIGGTLLVTPGFITDAVGLLLLFGTTRRLVARTLRRRLFTDPAAQPGGPGPDAGRRVDGLDVEVVEIEREQPPPGLDRRNGDPRG